MKRIQRDRDEQLKQRMADSQKLTQRNKNVLLDLVSKQYQEQKKTLEFLKYSLGNRPPADYNPPPSTGPSSFNTSSV